MSDPTVSVARRFHRRVTCHARAQGLSRAAVLDRGIRRALDRELAARLSADDVDIYGFGQLVIMTTERRLVALGLFAPNQHVVL